MSNPLDRYYSSKTFLSTLDIAINRSPYYRKTIDESLLERIKRVSDIVKLPVMPSTELRHDPFHFIADDIDAAQQVVVSSGSTGKPKIAFISKNDNSNDSNNTDEITGIRKSDKIVMLIMGTDSGTFVTPARWKKKGFHFIQVETSLISNHPTFIFRLMKKIKATVIKGHPNTMFKLTKAARELKWKVGEIGIRKIILTGSTLTHNIRRFMGETWKAEIFTTYGCNELGNLASECSNHHGLHINTRAVLLETIDLRNNQEIDGRLGKVLVTSMENNKSMVLLRYEIGDIARIEYGVDCPCGNKDPLIFPLGRIGELVELGTKSVTIYPYMVMDLISRWPELTGRFDLTVEGIRGVKESAHIRFETFENRVGNKKTILENIQKNFFKLFPSLKEDVSSKHLNIGVEFIKPDTILREWGRKPQSLLIDKRSD